MHDNSLAICSICLVFSDQSHRTKHKSTLSATTAYCFVPAVPRGLFYRASKKAFPALELSESTLVRTAVSFAESLHVVLPVLRVVSTSFSSSVATSELSACGLIRAVLSSFRCPATKPSTRYTCWPSVEAARQPHDQVLTSSATRHAFVPWPPDVVALHECPRRSLVCRGLRPRALGINVVEDVVV